MSISSKKIVKLVAVLLIIALIISIPMYFLNSLKAKRIKKVINTTYYYTEQDYGWAGSLTTRDLEFFEVRKFWFDKKVGKINWKSSVGPITVKIIDEKINNLKHLKISEANRPSLDTILSFKKYFDFEYTSWSN